MKKRLVNVLWFNHGFIHTILGALKQDFLHRIFIISLSSCSFNTNICIEKQLLFQGVPTGKIAWALVVNWFCLTWPRMHLCLVFLNTNIICEWCRKALIQIRYSLEITIEKEFISSLDKEKRLTVYDPSLLRRRILDCRRVVFLNIHNNTKQGLLVDKIT